jgi:chromosome segregation ATPase
MMFGLKKSWHAERTELLNKIAQMSTQTKEVTVEVTKPCDCHEELQKLVGDEAKLRKTISGLESETSKAKTELAETKLEHKITVEDIKHMQKLLDEKNELELSKKVFEAEKLADKEVTKIRTEYAKKLENELTVERKKMQEFMERVMDALPNVNVKLKG